MLRTIEIQNYAIISELVLDMGSSLNIITGETGAGKSILLGALGLIMGKRADSKVLYDADRKCVVEARFDIGRYGLKSLFEQEDLDYEDELIIRRTISTSGKSRAFINDEPTTLATLKLITDNLVDLHQQFDTLDIHNASFQINTIDALAGIGEEVEQYRETFKEFNRYKKQLKQLQEKQSSAAKEMDYLNFQMDEFNTAELIEGELTEKEQLLEKLSNSEEIKRVCQELNFVIEEGETNIADQLQNLQNELTAFSAVKELSELSDRLQQVVEELRDIGRESASVAEDTEYDPEEIENLNERINLINRLLKKHNVTDLNELLKIQDDIAEKLTGFADLTSEISAAEKALANSRKSIDKKAAEISAKRQKIVPSFEKKIKEMLAPLSMENAQLKVEITSLSEPNNSGMDDIAFLFSPNKGSDFKPLKAIASGGEISRLTLCIKALTADAITLPTLIFDEIDTGVSGEVAARMGDLMTQLSQKHQVISITHSPQIAARATDHYFVHKEDRPDRTVTAIRKLAADDRVVEIAKMLSGNPPSNAAIANAKELLKA